MAVGLPRTSCSWCLQTTWRCCIQKVWYWTFRQKVSLQAVSGKCKEAERKWIVEDVSKGIICWQNHWYPRADGRTVAVNCLLATGQPALRRQELYTGFYSERERLPCWCAKRFAGIPVLSGRLFNKSSTIHTVTQSCFRQEMQQGASDEAIVVKKFL